MTQWIRQGQSFNLNLGPFVSVSDGYSPASALAIAASHVRLVKNSGTFAAKTDTGTGSHMENGWYKVPLGASDTDTVGRLTVAVYMTGSALPVWREYNVVPANVQLSLIDGSDTLQVHVIEVSGSLLSASNFAASALTEGVIAASAGKMFADEWGDRNVAGSSTGGRMNKQAMYALRNKVAIVASTLTVYRTDDSTSEWTGTVTTASSLPITTIDPA